MSTPKILCIVCILSLVGELRSRCVLYAYVLGQSIKKSESIIQEINVTFA